MKTIEIVTHCYAKEMVHFASALVYQLSGFILHEPNDCRARICLCLDPNDEKTCKVAKHFFAEHLPCMRFVFQTPEHLGRRCIGRNEAALSSKADIVWFADVDQVFRDGVLDRLAEMEWPSGASMIYPRNIKIHKDHDTGDRMLYGLDGPKLVDIEPEDFIDKWYRKAIGGVQIVRGDFAREHGYLNGDEKWQRSTDEPFGDFRDDVAYRKFCLQHGPIVGVDLPGMFRLRHTKVTYR